MNVTKSRTVRVPLDEIDDDENPATAFAYGAAQILDDAESADVRIDTTGAVTFVGIDGTDAVYRVEYTGGDFPPDA